MHQVNRVGADRRQWHERDFKRSVDFHAVLLTMAGHDLRQHLQVILGTYGWLSGKFMGAPEHEQIERGQRAVAQMAEQLRQLISALRLHQETGRIERVPVRLGPLFSTLGRNAAELALQQRVELRVVPTQAVVASDPRESLAKCSEVHRSRRPRSPWTSPSREARPHRGPRHWHWHSVRTSG